MGDTILGLPYFCIIVQVWFLYFWWGENIAPLGPSVYGTSSNDLLQLEYIDLGLSGTGEKYIPMLRDDHSGYCWLYPASTTDTRTAADGLLDWSAEFDGPSCFMFDGPMHFRNETVRLLSEGLRTPH